MISNRLFNKRADGVNVQPKDEITMTRRV